MNFQSNFSSVFSGNETWMNGNETFLDDDRDFNSTSNYSSVDLQESLQKLSELLKGLNLNKTDDDDAYNDPAFSTKMLLDLLNFGPPTMSGPLCGAATCSLLLFIYYIPRMIYFRCTRFTSDVKKKGFALIIILSFLGCAGGVAHFLSFQEDLQLSSTFSTSDYDYNDGNDNETTTRATMIEITTKAPKNPENTMIYQIVVRTLNRAVSPIVLMVVIQQYLLYNNTHISEPFQNSIIQLLICIIITLILGLATFLGSKSSFALDPTQTIYNPLDVDGNFYDMGFPIIVAIIFHIVKSQIQKRIKYTAGEELISYMDRINKIVVYQFVMSSAAIAAYFFRNAESNSVTDSALHFLVAAFTPVVHVMLLKSLLRSKAPRRICFLLICSSEEQITAEQILQPDIQMSEKQAEDTQETLDHNKSIQIKMN
ncbi:unnamed protein product [Caenorhabditis angaria]|uniref:Uncharacterized protein n=1 Tax=Caenorhabditis angaria TaxID=860376 RepID=A0A9P1ITZ4_9PELO|nr:unnamed protein product [Caenorhabditis angaria]